MKKPLIISGVVVLAFAGLVFFASRGDKLKPEPTKDFPKEVAMCFYSSNQASGNLFDAAWVKMNILGEKVTGEFYNLPAEKDSKIGMFEGTVGPLNQASMSRTANVWWESLAEGMAVREELVIEFGEGSAVALFGEMADRGDGVYVYKDKTKLTLGAVLWQIDCEQLDKNLVESLKK